MDRCNRCGGTLSAAFYCYKCQRYQQNGQIVYAANSVNLDVSKLIADKEALEQQLHAANDRITELETEVKYLHSRIARMVRVVEAARTVIDARNGAINLTCYEHGSALNALEKALAELEAAP